MNPSLRSSRPLVYVVLMALVMAALLAVLVLPGQAAVKAKGIRRSSQVQAAVIQAPAAGPVSAPPAPAGGFTPQVRLGHTAGDQWEPAIAVDRFDHVYVLYPQYLGVPGCGTCPSPTMILVISADGGATWAAPRQITPPGSGQHGVCGVASERQERHCGGEVHRLRRDLERGRGQPYQRRHR
jgi:hypothetical protein